MKDFSAEQVRILRELFADVPLQAALLLNVPEADVNQLFERFGRFSVSYLGQPLDRRNYSILFRPGILPNDKTPMSESLVRKQIDAERHLLCVDKDFEFIDSQRGEASVTHASKRTDAAKSLEILVRGVDVYYVVCGKVIGEHSRERREQRSGTAASWLRPFSEFDEILRDHKFARIDGEKALKYWHKKKERILRSSPDTTEALFHGDLYWWLSNYVADRVTVFAEPTGFGQPKVDIAIATTDGLFLIEIKWLGENASGDKYGAEQVDKGLAQVGIYLDAQPDYIFGYLVVYDGRSAALSPLERSKWTREFKHGRCHDPSLIFLESEAPSLAASKAIKKR